jgi:hypothetical protein
MDAPLDFSLSTTYDVDRRAAVVVYLPQGMPKFDAAELHASLTHLVNQHWAPATGPDPTVTPYQIGPTAEWLPVFLITLKEIAPSALEAAADLVEVATGAIATIKALRAWKRSEEAKLEAMPGIVPTPPVLSHPLVLGFCLAHFADNYGALNDISVNEHVRTSHDFGSLHHPSGYEQYTIAISDESGTHVYVVNAFGEALDHFSILPEGIMPRPLPAWLTDNPPERCEPVILDEICYQ